MKKLLLFLLTILLPTVASAYDFEVDGVYYSIIGGNNNVKVVKGDFYYEGNITLPSTILCDNIEYRVSQIDDNAFKNCTKLKSVVIPESIVSLSYIFWGCTKLQTVVLPQNFKEIGAWMFLDCSSLENVTLPSNLEKIGEYAFSGCLSLKEIIIPKSVTFIGDAPLEECVSLNSIIVEDDNLFYDSRSNCNAIIDKQKNSLLSGCRSTVIPEDITEIGVRAFYGINKLKEITIPEGITKIGSGAFQNCTSLETIKLPKSLVKLESQLLDGCTSLSSVELPPSISSIDVAAFMGCKSLKTIDIPSTVSEIGQLAFAYTNLESITIPEGVTVLEEKTFYECNSLNKVVLPSTLKSIGNETFKRCYSLYEIRSYALEAPYTTNSSFESSPYQYATLRVNKDALEDYKSTWPWSEFGEIKPFGVNLIYIVDNVVYKTYELAEGTTIIPEPAPTKEGYIFSGWSEIPETMPAHDVIVTGTFERYFDAGNLTKVIDFIMNSTASAEDIAIYDLNNNEKLDIGDVILIVKFILNNSNDAPNSISRRAGEVADLCQYTAAQFEVKTTGNVDLRLVKNMELTHQMMYQQKDANTYAVVVYSLSNQLMQPENGKIIETDNNSDILSIENVTVATPTGKTAYYQTLSATTGIEQIENKNGTAVIYDLMGNRLNGGKAMNKGIYIVNGKKAVVR